MPAEIPAPNPSRPYSLQPEAVPGVLASALPDARPITSPPPAWMPLPAGDPTRTDEAGLPGGYSPPAGLGARPPAGLYAGVPVPTVLPTP